MVNTAQVRAGASVAVIGLGGVGLCSLLGAVAAGAREIIAIDLADAQAGLRPSSWAPPHLQRRATPTARSRSGAATGGGVEFAFELAGSVRALELAYRITRRGGTTVTAGLPPPTATLALPAVNLVAEERTLKGSYIGTAVPSRDIPRYIQLYQRGRLPVDRLMSGTLTLDEINEGFDLLHEGKAIRQVVDPMSKNGMTAMPNPWEEFAQRSRELYEQQAALTKSWFDGQAKLASTFAEAGQGDAATGSGIDAAAMAELWRSWLGTRRLAWCGHARAGRAWSDRRRDAGPVLGPDVLGAGRRQPGRRDHPQADRRATPRPISVRSSAGWAR